MRTRSRGRLRHVGRGGGDRSARRAPTPRIDAETSSGRVVLPPGLLRVSEQSTTRVRATAGAGVDTIEDRTSNGDIVVTATA